MSRNDITGDNIQTKGASNEYRNNFDAIFRKPKIVESNDGEKREQKEIVESTVLGVLPTE